TGIGVCTEAAAIHGERRLDLAQGQCALANQVIQDRRGRGIVEGIQDAVEMRRLRDMAAPITFLKIASATAGRKADVYLVDRTEDCCGHRQRVASPSWLARRLRDRGAEIGQEPLNVVAFRGLAKVVFGPIRLPVCLALMTNRFTDRNALTRFTTELLIRTILSDHGQDRADMLAVRLDDLEVRAGAGVPGGQSVPIRRIERNVVFASARKREHRPRTVIVADASTPICQL